MKIIIEHNGVIATIEDPDVVTIDEAFQLVKQALMGVGYHQTSVEEMLEEA